MLIAFTQHDTGKPKSFAVHHGLFGAKQTTIASLDATPGIYFVALTQREAKLFFTIKVL